MAAGSLAVRHAREGGFAIPVVLMVLLAATAFGHLIHYLARQELAVASAERDLLIARLAAEGGVRMVADTQAPLLTALPVGDSAALSGDHGHRGAYRVAAYRLNREIYLLRGEGSAGGTILSTVGRLTWALDPGARIAALPAAVSFATDLVVADSAIVETDRVAVPPLVWSAADCAPHLPLADSIFPAGQVTASSAWVPPVMALEPARRVRLPASPPSASLGALYLEELAASAHLTLGVVGGSSRIDMQAGCPATASGRWGTPLDPAGACGSYFPVVVVYGSLEVTGGQGQGVLVVVGEASFSGDATFAGLVLASGEVRMSDDARIAGWVRSGDRVLLENRARVVASACAGLRALSDRGLRAMRALPAGSWLSPV